MNIFNRFFFKKKFRLLHKNDFNKVFNSHKTNIYPCFIVFSMNNTLNYPRLGIIISKKVVKHAYKRNLIKRLIRESFRISKYFLLHLDFIILVNIQIIKINLSELNQYLSILWRRYYL